MRELNINTLKKHNQEYFQKGNKKFFNDISYTFLEHKNQRYLLTHTYGWSDMFGQPKKDFYTLKSVDNDTKISNDSKIFPNNPFGIIDYEKLDSLTDEEINRVLDLFKDSE